MIDAWHYLKGPSLAFFSILRQILDIGGDVRAKNFLFLPKLKFNLGIRYLFAFDVVIFESA